MVAFGVTVQMAWVLWGVVAIIGLTAIGIVALADPDEFVWFRPWRFNRALKAAVLPAGFMCPAAAASR